MAEEERVKSEQNARNNKPHSMNTYRKTAKEMGG